MEIRNTVLNSAVYPPRFQSMYLISLIRARKIIFIAHCQNRLVSPPWVDASSSASGSCMGLTSGGTSACDEISIYERVV